MYYFDNAATTFPKPENVYTYMDLFYRDYGVNVGRGQFKEASIANKLVNDTRDAILKLFHCNKGNKQVVFTASATEALNLVLRGIELNEGDVVYTTPFEHNSVIRTLHYLEYTKKIVIKYIFPDKKTFKYDFESILNKFEKQKPSLVIVNHGSNVIGTIAPIKEIFELAKHYDAVTVSDESQTAGLIDTDLIDSFCDYAVFAGHKTLYGPFGVGGVVSPVNASLKPLLYGGTGTESANPNMPSDEPIRYEAGSPNIQAIAGLNAAINWIFKTGIDTIRNKENEITNKLISLLNKYNNITVYAKDVADRIGVISCNFYGYSSDSIGQVLSNFDVACRTGLHCAPKAHEFIETAPAGTVRLSVGYFTNESDLEKLQEALDYIEINS